MASYGFTRAMAKLMSADLDLNGHDIRSLLVMSNSTVDTEEDTEFIAGFTTLDEMDGANYVRKALATEAVNIDTVNNRGEFDADDVTWVALGNGTRMVEGELLFRFVTNDADSVPILFRDYTNFNPGGLDLIVQQNAEGILQGANA